MPVFHPDGDDTVGPYRRLSASQLNVWNACPRQWFLEKVRRLKIAQTPPLHLGKAVELAVCKTLRESPGCVVRNAPGTILDGTPLDEDGRPDLSVHDGWPADALPLLLSRPDDLDDLRAWAYARLDVHLPAALDEEHAAWSKHERRTGDWSSVIDPRRALSMAQRAIDLHLEEVAACLAEGGGASLEAWRAGHRPTIPAPDGRAAILGGPHPLAITGAVDVLEAWEVCRPWFVDPSAASFVSQAVHPSFRFQGEYDLVYRWRGEVHIVDLKASTGASDRTAGYHEQLRAYAALWRATHDDRRRPAQLSIWFLGTGTTVDVEVPDDAWCDAFEASIDALWSQLKAEEPREEACPPAPAPYLHHAPGGAPVGPDDDPRARCVRCEWSSVCPGPDGSFADLPTSFQLPGKSVVTTVEKLGTIDPRVEAVLDVNSVFSGASGPPKVVLTDGQHQAELQVAGRHVPDAVDLNLQKGQRVRVVGALPQLWRGGKLVLKVDPASAVTVVEDEPLTSLALSRPARVDVVGRVAYLYEKSGVSQYGKPWRRPGLVVMDETGTMKVDGWGNAMPRQYDHLEAGDVVAITNLEAGAWISDLQGSLQDGSDIRVLARASDASAA